MARYGSFVYGDGTKYGIAPHTARLRWAVEIDWDNDGRFDGSNESEHVMDYRLRRGRDFFLNSSGDGFEPVGIGELTLILRNDSGRFDPYNTASPIYNDLHGNQAIRVRVYDADTSTWFNRFFGYIADIRPEYGSVPTVRLTAVDPLSRLQLQIRSNIFSNIRYDDAINECLTVAGWTGKRAIDSTVSDTMPYWWADRSAKNDIQDLTDAASGRFYAAADGAMTYKSRISADDPVMTLTDNNVLDSYRIRVPSPRDVVRNVVKIYARTRQQQTGIELWRAIDIPAITAGETKTVWANYNYNGVELPATSVTTPVASTDYAANTQSNGSGTDITANVTISMTQFAKSARLSITNNHATDTAYMTLLKLRGDGITADQYTFAEERDAASVQTYGERNLTIQTDWLQDYNQASDQAIVLAQLLANPRQFPRVKLRGQYTLQFLPDLFDVVGLSFASVGLSDQLRLSYIDEIWTTPTGNIVDTILQFEPSMTGYTSGSWVFPATFGLTTIFG